MSSFIAEFWSFLRARRARSYRVYEKPFLKFERLLETYLAFAPYGFASFRMATPLWLKQKLFQKELLGKRLRARAAGFDWEHKLLFGEHHQSHAASAFYPSPFGEALIVTMDGVGEWATTSVAIGRNHRIPDGSFRLNQEYFDYCVGLRMTTAALIGP